MKYLLPVLLLNLLAAALAQAASPADISVRDGYVRALPPTVRNTAAYMRVVNDSDAALVLTGARSPAADSVTLHETIRDGGQLSMRHVMTARIPAGGDLLLEAGGRHLMMMGLGRPLAPGEMVTLTLLFEGGVEKTVQLPVRSVLDE